MSHYLTIKKIGQAIAYYPNLTKKLGSVNASILLSQFIYWHDKTDNPLGFYKSLDEIKAETGLSRREQESGRKVLRELNLITETYKREEHKLYFLFNVEAFNEWFDLDEGQCTKRAEGNAQNVHRQCAKRAQAMRKTDIRYIHKNTTENTQENTKDIVAQSATASSTAKPDQHDDEKQSEKKSKFSFARELANLGGKSELIADWLAVRKTKKGTNTQVSFKRFTDELNACKYDINTILELCIVMEWRGFGANWLLENQKAKDELQKILNRNAPVVQQKQQPSRPDISKVKPL